MKPYTDSKRSREAYKRAVQGMSEMKREHPERKFRVKPNLGLAAEFHQSFFGYKLQVKVGFCRYRTIEEYDVD